METPVKALSTEDIEKLTIEEKEVYNITQTDEYQTLFNNAYAIYGDKMDKFIIEALVLMYIKGQITDENVDDLFKVQKTNIPILSVDNHSTAPQEQTCTASEK